MFRELNTKADGTAGVDEFRRWLASPSVRMTPRADTDAEAIFKFFCTGGRYPTAHDVRAREHGITLRAFCAAALRGNDGPDALAADIDLDDADKEDDRREASRGCVRLCNVRRHLTKPLRRAPVRHRRHAH